MKDSKPETEVLKPNQTKWFVWAGDAEDSDFIPKNQKTIQFIFNLASESVDVSCRYSIEQNQCL